jgi:hypothetical protein|nr:MAG TPA: Transcriptional regulator, multiple antibiotic resistance protein.04A [Caudoviricetes sp.]DAZ55325.1 MAG TPA: Transcriptional regulator, multiple antibiotic resistance protein.04A [Caudoviricetes sp.]
MKLNPDCIRGILLTVEEKCNFDTPWEYDRDTFESEYLAEFSHEEIVYHIKQASASNLIENVHYYDGGATVLIGDLTPLGHEFLSNIRTKALWNKVKSKAADASLSILMELAKRAATNYFLGLDI